MRESHPAYLRAFVGRTRRAAAALAAVGVAALLTAQSTAAVAQEDILNYKGPDREQKLIDGANKEGEVVFYSAMIVNQALRPIADAFQKKYPSVKVSYWRADDEDMFAKLSAEEHAKNLVGDLAEGANICQLATSAGWLTPYYSPSLDEYPADERDPNNLWAPTRLSYFGAAYNTNLVPADKMPKTYEALLDPQWKGKMAWRIGTVSGTPLFITNLRLAWGEDKAMAYFKKLATQKIINFGSGSARTLVDRTLAGEYPIALNIFAHHPLISRAEGAPVNSQLIDPVPTMADTMCVLKGGHHPYSALLLADFILSKEGQQVLTKAMYFSPRPDVPPLPLLALVIPKNAGVNENFIAPDKLQKYNESSEKIYEELFR
jgi:ABC-type Fe3+ transport system substrate-binding protein